MVLLLIVILVFGGLAALLASRPTRTPDGLAPVIHERVKQPEYHPELVNVTVANESVTYVHRTESPTLNYSVGDIIVGTTGNGYLRWVRGIQRDGNRTIVRTDQASLAHAIVHGGFSLNQSVLPRGRDFGPFNLSVLLFQNEEVKVYIVGELEFSLDFALTAAYGFFGLDSLYFAVTKDVKLTFGLEVQGRFPAFKEYPLFSETGAPITFAIGPLPVVLVPKVTLTLGAEFETEMTMKAHMNSHSVSGVQYDGSSWSPVDEHSFDLTSDPPEVPGAVDAKVFALAPRFELLLYDVAGPFAEVKPYVRLHASLDEDPWWALYAGIDLNAGLTLRVFDYDIGDVSFNLLHQEWDLVHASENHPSAPRNLTAEPRDGSVHLTWQSPQTDGGSAITNYTVLRGDTSGAATPVETLGPFLAYDDTRVTNARTYFYTVRAHSGNLEGPPSAEASAKPTAGPSAWTNTLADGAPGSPPPRWAHAGAYDAATNRMVVFGGADRGWFTLYNDTWVLSNANGLGGLPAWTNLIADGASGSPSARGAHTSVYDATNNRMVIFGGEDASTLRNDVWVLSNANGLGGPPTWTNTISDGAPGSPTARVYATAVYDPASNRAIMFGGESASALLNDVWVLSNANGLGGTPSWTNLIPDGAPGSPGARRLHSAVYNTTSNRMIVFGGGNATVHNDVWVLSNANGLGGTPTWTNTHADGAAGSPFGRRAQTAVYDTQNDRMIVFAGEDSGGATHDDVWVLANASGVGGVWTNTAADGSPGAPWDRRLHTAFYDAPNNRMVVFAGATGSVLNDVWVLSNASGLP